MAAVPPSQRRALSVLDGLPERDAQSQVKAVSESGVTINVVGTAIDAASQAGDVIRVMVLPFSY